MRGSFEVNLLPVSSSPSLNRPQDEKDNKKEAKKEENKTKEVEEKETVKNEELARKFKYGKRII